MEDALRPGADEPGLNLIETMYWNGSACPLVDWHWQRLSSSAAALGWRCDKVAFDDAITGPDHPARIRLTLDRNGEMALTHAELPPSPAVWKVTLATERFDSSDPWLRHKTTRRGIFDRARAGMAPGIDELLFLNERGEVCEGTITTVFFDSDDGLATPPIESGLLRGVLRTKLLAEGWCHEAILRPDQLSSTRLYVGNALRGLMSAEFVGP